MILAMSCKAGVRPLRQWIASSWPPRSLVHLLLLDRPARGRWPSQSDGTSFRGSRTMDNDSTSNRLRRDGPRGCAGLPHRPRRRPPEEMHRPRAAAHQAHPEPHRPHPEPHQAPLQRAPKLLARVRSALHARQYSRGTVRAYVGWIRRYVHFHKGRSYRLRDLDRAVSQGPLRIS
jgi:hypothetical protein